MRALGIFIGLLFNLELRECASYLSSIVQIASALGGEKTNDRSIIPRSGTTSSSAVYLRQIERAIWEPTWQQFKDKQSVIIDQNSEEKDFVDVSGLEFQPLSATPDKLFERMLSIACRIPGRIDHDFEILKKLNFFMYLWEEEVENSVVIMYRPLLLNQKLDPYALRLLNHRLAAKLYPELEAIVSHSDNVGKKILLVGAAEAGLLASYHAIMLIRKCPAVGDLGGGKNDRNQVQVLGLNTPPPFTHEVLDIYRLATHNYFCFRPLTAKDPDFGYLGELVPYVAVVESFEGTPPVTDAEIQVYFNLMNLNDLNMNELAKYPIAYTNFEVRTEYSEQQTRCLLGLRAATTTYKPFFEAYPWRFIYVCAKMLQKMLKRMFLARNYDAQTFVSKNNMVRNWTLGNEVKFKCSVSIPDTVNCMVKKGNVYHIFATYHVVYTLKEAARENVHGSLQGIKKVVPEEIQQDGLQAEGAFQECLFDLFEAQPVLRILSPFHRDSSFQLKAEMWPHQPVDFNVKLMGFKGLEKLLKDNHALFLQIMTSPTIDNPLRCQRNMLPVPGEYDWAKIREYWGPFVTFLSNHLTSKEYEVLEFHKPATLPINSSQLFDVIHKNLDEFTLQNHFDCTDPQTRWHSLSTCPPLCHILNSSSECCRRIYISASGLKISLRGAAKYGGLVWSDTSLMELNFVKDLKLDEKDHAVILVTLKKVNDGKILYLVVFAEGQIYNSLLAGDLAQSLSITHTNPTSYSHSQVQ